MPNTKEIFNKYSKWYVAHADIPLMNFDDFNEALGEILSLPVELPVKPACESLQKRFDIYASAINAIDDFFEYRYSRYSPKQIKEVVMRIIDNITEQLAIKNFKT